MKNKLLILVTIIICLVTACAGQSTVQSTPVPTPQRLAQNFPLAKGAYWIYEGNVQWQKSDTSDIQQKNMTLKMEVIEVIELESLKAYLLKGHPRDLAWYEEGKEPREHVIVQVGAGKYYLSDNEKTWQRLKDKHDMLFDLVSESELFLELPLAKGNAFGETSLLTRVDGGYHWNVIYERQATFSNIKGISSDKSLTQYSLRFQTMPDHTVVDFVPGIGITHYEYGHHGTVSNVDVKLIEYHAGQE